MSYCGEIEGLGSVKVVVPQRALRPREPAPPRPSKTMASPMVATRMLRPRTKPERSLAGVDVKAKLAKLREVKKQQRRYEAQLKVLVEKLRRVEKQMDPQQRKALQSRIDRLIECIKALAAQANQLAMDAIKGGASQADVRAAVGEGTPAERMPVQSPPAAPVIETRSPALLPDGSVVPGPDATVTTPETGKPVEPEKEAAPGEKVDAQADEGKMHPLLMLAVAGGALWALSRVFKRAA